MAAHKQAPKLKKPQNQTIPQARPNLFFDIDNLTIHQEGKINIDWPILDALEKTHLELTMRGASVLELTCEDPEFSLLNDPFFAGWMLELKAKNKKVGKASVGKKSTKARAVEGFEEEEELEEHWSLPNRKIDLSLEGIWFRLVGFKMNETKFTLVFEDRTAASLREETGRTITATRSAYMTRARFINLRVKEAAKRHNDKNFEINFFCPEENIHQPTKESTEAPESVAAGPTNTTEKELTTADNIQIKGVTANTSQLKILNEALAEAVQLKSLFTAKVALVEALIQENDVGEGNEPGVDVGVLSQTHEVAGVDPHNVRQVVAHFLTAGFTGAGGANELARKNPSWSADEVAQAVQGSAFPKAYGQWKTEAERIVKIFGGTTEGGASTASQTATYPFTIKANQNFWDAIQAFAAEVGWYAFVRENTLFFVSGDWLYKQPTQMLVERGKVGVEWVNPNIEIGARDGLAEIEVKARGSLWTALPGGAVRVARVGPANGKWIVNTASLDILDPAGDLTVKLEKPLPPKKEPAASKAAASSSAGEGSTAGYVNPFKSITNLTPERIDMGVDFGGSGQIVALGDCIIEHATNSAAWPGGGWVSYKLVNGTYSGKIVYHAENIHVLVQQGQKVKAGEPVAELKEGYPNSESGWAIAGTSETTLAASLNQQAPGDPGGWESAAGHSFNNLLVSLGCPSGVKQSGGPHGTMPAGYP